jgi:hypothetical protein
MAGHRNAQSPSPETATAGPTRAGSRRFLALSMAIGSATCPDAALTRGANVGLTQGRECHQSLQGQFRIALLNESQQTEIEPATFRVAATRREPLDGVDLAMPTSAASMSRVTVRRMRTWSRTPRARQAGCVLRR